MGQALTNFNQGNPDNYYTTAVGQTLNVIDNQYFQYKAIFRGDGTDGLELQSVGLLNNLYATTDPTVEIVSGQRLEYVDLRTFTETPGPQNQGSMRYQLMEEGDGNWKYFDIGGTDTWITAPSQATALWAEANDASDLTQARMEQFDDDVTCSPGPCYVLWRALLRSSGTTQVQLDNVAIDAPNKITVTAPISQTMTVGNPFDVTWTFLGDVANVDIDYTLNQAQYFSLATNVPADAGTGCGDPGPDAGCYQVPFVPDAISSTFRIRVSETGDATVTNDGGTNTTEGLITIVDPNPPAASETFIAENVMTIRWIANGSMGGIADTVIDIDTQYAEGAYGAGAAGHTVISAVARNDNNGFACVPPSVSFPQYGGCYEWTIPADQDYRSSGCSRANYGQWQDRRVR